MNILVVVSDVSIKLHTSSISVVTAWKVLRGQFQQIMTLPQLRLNGT